MTFGHDAREGRGGTLETTNKTSGPETPGRRRAGDPGPAVTRRHFDAPQYLSCNPLTGQWGRILNDGSGTSILTANTTPGANPAGTPATAYDAARCNLAAVLFVAGGLLIWGSTYTHNMVHNQLAAQQIFFPPKAAFAHPTAGTEITPSMVPSVSQYAGQQLLTGQQAQSYADNFIAVHISNMTGGKTYSQLSAESMAQPNNAKLATTVNTVWVSPPSVERSS